MILRGQFTRRRKALLILVLVVLGWLGYAWYADIAITQGLEQQDMDWNGDGTVSRTEVLQAFYAVGVKTTDEGNRHCKAFYWRSSGEQIRVDCRTVFGEAKPE
ncbi:EF-hand domain-containing protein [Stenotrophomonas sp.]|uniref:EF-hand domain-containing protein n=1 Tax=Stenotrophomonas sp. TaxID=69392 RepID=UPI0028A21319|nr:EF-hand domain-containing protein [Stenotrophomonas sp.]